MIFHNRLIDTYILAIFRILFSFFRYRTLQFTLVITFAPRVV